MKKAPLIEGRAKEIRGISDLFADYRPAQKRCYENAWRIEKRAAFSFDAMWFRAKRSQQVDCYQQNAKAYCGTFGGADLE